jgi:hypothetical protein
VEGDSACLSWNVNEAILTIHAFCCTAHCCQTNGQARSYIQVPTPQLALLLRTHAALSRLLCCHGSLRAETRHEKSAICIQSNTRLHPKRKRNPKTKHIGSRAYQYISHLFACGLSWSRDCTSTVRISVGVQIRQATEVKASMVRYGSTLVPPGSTGWGYCVGKLATLPRRVMSPIPGSNLATAVRLFKQRLPATGLSSMKGTWLTEQIHLPHRRHYFTSRELRIFYGRCNTRRARLVQLGKYGLHHLDPLTGAQYSGISVVSLPAPHRRIKGFHRVSKPI